MNSLVATMPISGPGQTNKQAKKTTLSESMNKICLLVFFPLQLLPYVHLAFKNEEHKSKKTNKV